VRTLTNPFAVLHLYYKLAYIKLNWGGPDEQAVEIEAGNLNAKDWHDEARKIIESTVRCTLFFTRDIVLTTGQTDVSVL